MYRYIDEWVKTEPWTGILKKILRTTWEFRKKGAQKTGQRNFREYMKMIFNTEYEDHQAYHAERIKGFKTQQ